MATDTLKTPSITNFDASAVVLPYAGMGAQGYRLCVNDHVASTAGATAGSTYRMCRIPTNAKIKQVLLTAASTGTTGAYDIDIAHSDSTTDGTPVALQGNVVGIPSSDNKLFGAALSSTTALKNSDITFSGTFTTAHQNLELWNVLVGLGTTAFSADPGGFFDILLKTTTANASAGDLAVEVEYVC
jgi:hypothetical protein